jgi:hypothetical protein
MRLAYRTVALRQNIEITTSRGCRCTDFSFSVSVRSFTDACVLLAIFCSGGCCCSNQYIADAYIWQPLDRTRCCSAAAAAAAGARSRRGPPVDLLALLFHRNANPWPSDVNRRVGSMMIAIRLSARWVGSLSGPLDPSHRSD